MADEDHSGVHDESDNPDIHFEPVVQLAPVEVKTMEENEDILIKLRSRLYRFDAEAETPEWKERGTGDVKLLKHNKTGRVRLLMRREKTLKICANHFLTSEMELRPHGGADKAFVWTTLADLYESECKRELFAIRFGNTENAEIFKTTFEKACKEIGASIATESDEVSVEKSDERDVETDKVADELDKLKVAEESDETTTTVVVGDSSDKAKEVDPPAAAAIGDTKNCLSTSATDSDVATSTVAS